MIAAGLAVAEQNFGPLEAGAQGGGDQCEVASITRPTWTATTSASAYTELGEVIKVPGGARLMAFATGEATGNAHVEVQYRPAGASSWTQQVELRPENPSPAFVTDTETIDENTGFSSVEWELRFRTRSNVGSNSIAYTAHLLVWELNSSNCAPRLDLLDPLSLLGDNPAFPQSCTCYATAADPVNTLTGNYHDTWTDMAIPGRGMGLTWARSYNSAVAAQDGPLGKGWTHRFNLRVEPDWGSARVHQESGSQVLFLSTGLWTYETSSWNEATLSRDPVSQNWTFTRNGGRDTFVFESGGALLSHEDLNGYVTTFSYEDSEHTRLATITDEADRTLSLTWTGNRIDTVSDPHGRVVDYDYTTSGHLQRVTDVDHKTWDFGYEPTGDRQLTTIRAPRFEGMATPPLLTNVYDSLGRVDSQTDQLNRLTDFSYNGDNIHGSINRTVTFPDGDRRLDAYQGGVLVAVTDGHLTTAQGTTYYEHDPESLGVSKITDPLNHVWIFGYDSRSNQDYARDPLGRETTAVFNALSLPSSVTDGEDVVTTFGYDANWNLEVTTFNGQPSHRYYRDDPAHPGDVTSMKGPDDKLSVLTYDPYGQVASITDPVGNKTTSQYNNVGWLLSTVAPEGNVAGSDPALWTTTYANHTAHGAPRLITNPEGEQTAIVYDAHGNQTSVTDAENRTTGYVYDNADQLITIQRPDNTNLANDYWPDGSLKSQTDGASRMTLYEYDARDRLTRVTDPLGRQTAYAYDVASRLTGERDASRAGNCGSGGYPGCITYTYDDANQLKTITYGDGTTPNVTNTVYDDAGRREQQTTSLGTSIWDWDTFGRLESYTHPVEGTTTYTYDGNTDRIKTITYPGNKTVTRNYDNAGRYTSMVDWDGRVTTFGYDANSQVDEVLFPTTTTNRDVIGRDRVGRVTSIDYLRGATTLGTLDYGRDDTGLVESSTPVSLPGDANRTYTYSPLRQLEGVSGSPTSYDYDASDNLVRLTTGATQSFDAANQLCWSSPTGATGTCASTPSGATDYDYDATGNRTSATAPSGLVGTYSYDEADRLETAAVPAPGDASEGQYNPLPEARIVDTRTAFLTGTCTPSPCARLVANQSTTMAVLGRGGIPASGVEAVVANVTYLNPAGTGWSKVNPDASNQASAALTHFNTAGLTENTMVVAIPDAQGRITVRSTTAVDVVVDVVGFYTAPSGASGSVFEAVTPTRLADTRDGTGVCPTAACARLVANQNVDVTVAGRNGLPATDIDAVTVNITVVSPAAAGSLKVNPTAALVGTATLNYQTNKANNLTTVAEVGADGRFTIRSTAATDVVIDVVGYHTSPSGSEGSIFQPLTPARVTKTISGEGTCVPAPCNRMAAGESVRYKVAGVGGVPTAGVDAVVLDVSIEAPSAAGFAKVNPTGGTNLAQAAATLHYGANQTVNDVVVAQLDAEGYVTIFTQQAADVIIDVSGWYRPLTGVWTYRYDGDGLRVAKVAPQGQTTNYTWDHTSGLPLLLAETTGGQTTRWTYGPGGQPVSQHNPDGSVVFFHQDQIGSTRLLTSTTGTVAATYTYDPYGRQTSKTGTASTPLGYTGQYTDLETGFQYLRARFYDPATGQFLTRDPLEVLTREAYGYAEGDPLNAVDPSGTSRVRLPTAGDLVDGLTGSVSTFFENIDVVEVVETVNAASSYVAAGAALCTVAGAASVVGAPVAAACATVGVVAGATSMGTSIGLWATGHRSTEMLALDGATFGLGEVFAHWMKAGRAMQLGNPSTGFFPSTGEILGTFSEGFGGSLASILAFFEIFAELCGDE
jgi:RHS repeat-associated protein